jgi:DNA-binding NtrC family response regulator
MERAAIPSDGKEIDAAALQLSAPRPAEGEMPSGMLEEKFSWEGTLQDVSARAIEYIERFKIDAALRASKWNKTRAAEQLGVSYKTLLTKIRALGLEE